MLVYRGICYGPASSTKTGHLSPSFSSQLGYHVTGTGPRAGQLCVWVSQGLGTTQVRSLETREQPHSLAPHGEACIYRDTPPKQRCNCFRDESVLSGDKKENNNKESSTKYRKRKLMRLWPSSALSMCRYIDRYPSLLSTR